MDKNDLLLKQVYELYTQSEGINTIAHKYNIKISTPKRKVWLMLLGNHSAGKSSYINWYVGQDIQKTGVAIETTAFTLICSGKNRQSLLGQATLELFPFLKDIQEISHVKENLLTEIITSTSKEFKNLVLLDTPGLVDGQMNYTFDPEKTLFRLAREVDLIFTFFDPIGQALCTRTMNIVEKISTNYPEKLFFFLSKADQVPDETDRQRVLIQIAQNVTQRIPNNFSLNIPTIYLPTKEETQPPVRNHISATLLEIEKAIQSTLQKVLNQLKNDLNNLQSSLQQSIQQDEEKKRALAKRDNWVSLKLILFSLFCTLLVYLFGIWGVIKSIDVELIGYGGLVSVFAVLLESPDVLCKKDRRDMEEELVIVEGFLESQAELYQDFFDAHLDREEK